MKLESNTPIAWQLRCPLNHSHPQSLCSYLNVFFQSCSVFLPIPYWLNPKVWVEVSPEPDIIFPMFVSLTNLWNHYRLSAFILKWNNTSRFFLKAAWFSRFHLGVSAVVQKTNRKHLVLKYYLWKKSETLFNFHVECQHWILWFDCEKIQRESVLSTDLSYPYHQGETMHVLLISFICL